MQHAEEAYRLRMAATKRFTDRASAMATIRARFMRTWSGETPHSDCRQEAARELRSENNHADKRAQEYLEHLQQQYLNEYYRQQQDAVHAEQCEQAGTADDPIDAERQ